jgi:hypothetical protein
MEELIMWNRYKLDFSLIVIALVVMLIFIYRVGKCNSSGLECRVGEKLIIVYCGGSNGAKGKILKQGDDGILTKFKEVYFENCDFINGKISIKFKDFGDTYVRLIHSGTIPYKYGSELTVDASKPLVLSDRHFSWTISKIKPNTPLCQSLISFHVKEMYSASINYNDRMRNEHDYCFVNITYCIILCDGLSQNEKSMLMRHVLGTYDNVEISTNRISFLSQYEETPF